MKSCSIPGRPGVLDYRWAILRQINNFSVEENFLVFSSPRGGSTWITELVASIPKTTILWEPLCIDNKRSAFGKLGFPRLVSNESCSFKRCSKQY